MKKRNDPPGYPDDDRITQWYNELKEMVREQLGLSEAEHVMRSTYEDAVRRCAPIRRAIGILFRAVREERKLLARRWPSSQTYRRGRIREN